jgi:sugar lactone lactonase YvrE
VSKQARVISGSVRAALGEGPVWDDRTQTLYWVDIEAGQLHSCNADGSDAASVSVGERLGCVALREAKPGFIAGLEHGIAFLNPAPLEVLTLARPESQQPRNRCNDGKCDSHGRFWVGTYNMDGKSATGWLYRVDATGAVERVAGPCICMNGPAFSPTGDTIYYVDSYGRAVYRAAVNSAGQLSMPRVFTTFADPEWGYPDGLTCDAAGCVWIAHWGGSRISRFGPDGSLEDVIPLPVRQPTSCTFGGPDLRTLFVTSASMGLDEAHNENGLAGALFAVDVGVAGIRAARFAG